MSETNPERDWNVPPPSKSSQPNYDLVTIKFIKVKNLCSYMYHPSLVLQNLGIFFHDSGYNGQDSEYVGF